MDVEEARGSFVMLIGTLSARRGEEGGDGRGKNASRMSVPILSEAAVEFLFLQMSCLGSEDYRTAILARISGRFDILYCLSFIRKKVIRIYGWTYGLILSL